MFFLASFLVITIIFVIYMSQFPECVTMPGYWHCLLWWHNDVVYAIIDTVDGYLAAILIGDMLWRE